MTDFFKLAKDNTPIERKAQTGLALLAQTGDASARQDLVLCNMRLAINVARKHQRNGIELEDLIATAAGATLDAIRVFDPSKGANFPTVARQWMVARCQEVVKSRGVVSGDDRTTRVLYRKVYRARQVLEAQGVEVTTETLADHLKIDSDKIADAWAVVFGSATSFSAPCGDEDSATFGDLLASKTIRQDVAMDRARNNERVVEVLAAFVDTLSLRDKHIFRNRNLAEYLGNEPVGQLDLGADNGISKQRVGQIERSLSAKCAEFFKKRGIMP